MVVGYLGGTQLVPSTGPYPYPVRAVRDLRDADTTRHGTGKDYFSVTTKQVRQTGPAEENRSWVPRDTHLVPFTGPYPYPVKTVRELRDADTPDGAGHLRRLAQINLSTEPRNVVDGRHLWTPGRSERTPVNRIKLPPDLMRLSDVRWFRCRALA